MGALAGQLENGEREGAELSSVVALLSAYRAPEDRHLSAALEAGDAAAALIEERVAAPRRRQQAIARNLVPATPVDASNAILTEQYEAHPYPAWTAEPADPPALPAAVVQALGGVEAVRSVLVAGCGTGQHAFAAARAWPRADIVAVDLSRTSLAYAIDKAEETNPNRVEFVLADLLQVGRLGRQFDVIEAMGVLHHLAEPEVGLRALQSVLKPGGIIGIALYSAAARPGLGELRARFGSDARTDEEVRRFRAWALAEADTPELLYSPDFYSIGGCRDAVFNVRERGYSLDEVAALIDRAGLRLLALQPPPRARRLLQSLPGPTDLAGWAEAERSHPQLFISMYEVWLQDPGTVG